MKNRVLFLTILVSFIFFCGCFNKKYTSYVQITYDEYKQLFKEKRSFILYLGSKTCSHCMEFKPTLEKIISEYNIEVKYLDVSELSDSEYEQVKSATKLQGTPTIVFVTSGNVLTDPRIIGAVSYENAVRQFKRSGYIDAKE